MTALVSKMLRGYRPSILLDPARMKGMPKYGAGDSLYPRQNEIRTVMEIFLFPLKPQLNQILQRLQQDQHHCYCYPQKLSPSHPAAIEVLREIHAQLFGDLPEIVQMSEIQIDQRRG